MLSNKIVKTCLATSFGYIVVQLDITIVNVAMPSIGKSYSTDLSSLQWISDSYVIIFAALLISSGIACDKYGARRIYFTGLCLFLLSSLICAAAPTVLVLIISRAFQGLAAALILPSSLSLLALSSSHNERNRIKAIGWWSAIGGFVSATGPFIGGLLIDNFDWRAIFLINIPICLIGLMLTNRLLEESPLQKNKNLDVKGQLLAISSIFSLIWAAIEAGKNSWIGLPVYLGLTIFLITLVLFILHERKTAHPMLPLTLFKINMFSSSLFIGLIINFTFYGSIFILSIYMQYVREYSPTLTGLALMTFVVIIFANLGSAKLAGLIGNKATVLTGVSITAIAYLLIYLVVVMDGSYLLLVLSLIFMPIGTGIAMPALLTTFLSSVDDKMSGTASAIINSFRQLGSALGIALLGMLITGKYFSVIDGTKIALLLSAFLMVLGIFIYRAGKRA